MKCLMNCFQHNTPSTHICLQAGCVHRLACPSCLTTEHIGHVDSHVTSIKKFQDKIFLEFQRMKKVLYKDDLLRHIQKEFDYLQEKTQSILRQREQKITEFINNQYVHSEYLKHLIEHIELMKENKIYEEGLKAILPMLNQGVQETLSKFEKDKLRIVMRVKELINQIKTVLDGLFYIGNQYQLDQHQMKVQETEQELKKNEDKLFQSAVLLSQPKTYENPQPKPYGSYQQFVDGLFPQKQLDYVQLYNTYNVQSFNKQEPFERTDIFKLYGVIDHQSSVHSVCRLRSGEIMTCSKMVSIFEYPSLKMIQQTGYNQSIRQIVQLSSNAIAVLNDQSIQVYDRRGSRWVPKGEFITPGVGKYSKIYCKGELFIIIVETQILIYKLRQDIQVDLPVEYLVTSQTPNVFMHKYDCSAIAFIDNENRFYSADVGGRLYKWRTNNVYSTENVIQAAQTEIVGIVPLHDGRVITIEYCGLIKLWDNLLQGTVTVVKHRSNITSYISFKRDIDNFFTGDSSGKIQKWKCSILIESIYELEAHNDQINDLMFDQYLISSSADKKVKLWQV